MFTKQLHKSLNWYPFEGISQSVYEKPLLKLIQMITLLNLLLSFLRIPLNNVPEKYEISFQIRQIQSCKIKTHRKPVIFGRKFFFHIHSKTLNGLHCTLILLKKNSSYFILGCAVQLVDSQFPDQGQNQGPPQ